MFPQSELDNYKLQVELLQEKLQKSEISRKQLEHKLDKILQKRDEHDKMVRSKARHKYQQFLEEQQRRNERNKQLVQMLERIEQQTEAMNGRSERLKMMKLQYEMYFAKLVHSQTRRCIQNSVHPVTQMMHTSPTQPMHSTVLQPTLQGYNYGINIETPVPTMSYPYRSHTPTSYFEEDSFLRSQPENMSMKTQEIPTLENFVRTSKNDCEDFRNLNVALTAQTQQSNEHHPIHESINNNNNTNIPANGAYYKQEMPDNNTFYPKTNNNVPLSSATNLLANDKQLSEFKDNSNLSTTTSSTFEKIPNLALMKQKMHNLNEFSNKKNTITETSNESSNNSPLNNNENLQPLHYTQDMSETSLKNTNQKDQNATSNLQNGNQYIKLVNSKNELETHDTKMPKSLKKPLTSLELETSKGVIETSPKSSNNNNKPTEQIENESNSSTTPVSIENIENEIYGELLSPLETDEVQKHESPNVVPKLLENLVTQHGNVGIEDIPSEEPIVEHARPLNTNSVTDSTATCNKIEQNSVTNNYEQPVDYNDYNNAQQDEEVTNNFADYTNYANDDNIAINEGQQEQQLQYDYSNYDATQYSYPGYIYDETTGEYKPDLNTPAEQYATDQQYSAESYDQQYQQQDYDYNQTYSEEPTITSTTESTAYNNYNTQQQEISANLSHSDNNEEQQQTTTKPEPIAPQPNLTPEEVPIPSTKVIKPTSILSTTEKNDWQKKKKRVNFIDSSETDESAAVDKGTLSTTKPTTGNLSGSSESDFDFSSSVEAEAKAT